MFEKIPSLISKSETVSHIGKDRKCGRDVHGGFRRPIQYRGYRDDL